MSIERSSQFHQVRRILKIVAPSYRILANPGLAPGGSAIDLKKKTVEVAEEVSGDDFTPHLLFQIGHAIYHNRHGVSVPNSKEFLAKQNVEIDKFASSWTTMVLFTYFNFKIDEARKAASKMVWSYDEWFFYFSD